MDEGNILGCYLSYPSVMHTASVVEKQHAKYKGDLFRSYLWGEHGISDSLKKLKSRNYGNDVDLILLQFYIDPLNIQAQHLKPVESYRKKEKSIGVCLIINGDNFVSLDNAARIRCMQDVILERIDVLAQALKKKKLDTNVSLLKSDLLKVFENSK